MAFAQTSSVLPVQTIKLGNVTLTVEIADTPDTMAKGLMFHAPLSFNQGMLFVFNPPQVATMWMKDMQFPIDMIWFDGNGTILHIEKNLPPCTGPDSSCAVYDGNSQITSYVLETASGFVDHYGIDNKTRFVFITPGQSTSTLVPHFMVPEFGPIASLVFAISTISIIVVSVKTGLRQI
jgi:predicted secreted protein with PEFG-CTERM motif